MLLAWPIGRLSHARHLQRIHTHALTALWSNLDAMFEGDGHGDWLTDMRLDRQPRAGSAARRCS